jgi:hypothetical protein
MSQRAVFGVEGFCPASGGGGTRHPRKGAGSQVTTAPGSLISLLLPCCWLRRSRFAPTLVQGKYLDLPFYNPHNIAYDFTLWERQSPSGVMPSHTLN